MSCARSNRRAQWCDQAVHRARTRRAAHSRHPIEGLRKGSATRSTGVDRDRRKHDPNRASPSNRSSGPSRLRRSQTVLLQSAMDAGAVCGRGACPVLIPSVTVCASSSAMVDNLSNSKLHYRSARFTGPILDDDAFAGAQEMSACRNRLGQVRSRALRHDRHHSLPRGSAATHPCQGQRAAPRVWEIIFMT
jgi:hypothetical protein